MLMPETIGQQLKQAREARNLTLLKVTQATHIQAHILEAIEADDFEALPSPVQARAFLRLYAEFLKLSLDDLIANQRLGMEEASAIQKAKPAQSPLSGSEELFESPPSAEPLDESRPDNFEGNDNKFNRLLVFFQRILRRPKTSSLHPEPVEPSTPSEPGLNAGEKVEPTNIQVEEPILGKMEELPSEETPQEPQESQNIFTNIGQALRQRREELSLTFDEIEHHTHVRKHYLQSLERGDFDHLPSSVQTRGMLNNYAHFLDMDVDAILLKFADGLQIQRLERQPAPAEEKRISEAKTTFRVNLPPGLRRYLSMDILVGVGLILTLLVFAIWGTSRVFGLRSASTPQPTARSISDVLGAPAAAGTATPLISSTAGTEAVVPTVTFTPAVTIPAGGTGPVQVVLVALGQAFVRVTVDGKIQFNGRIAPGTAYPFDGNNQIEILTGDGAAISILFNQSNLGPMGGIGEVVDRIYTANAILNPTATFTPSPTITPIHSLTPTPTTTPSAGSTLQTPSATKVPK